MKESMGVLFCSKVVGIFHWQPEFVCANGDKHNSILVSPFSVLHVPQYFSESEGLDEFDVVSDVNSVPVFQLFDLILDLLGRIFCMAVLYGEKK